MTEEEKIIATICEEKGVTYVIATTGDELRSDTEKLEVEE